MSASTITPQADSVRARQPQWVRAARMHLRIYLWVWAIIWVAAAVIVPIVIFIIDAAGTVNVSIAQFVRNGPLMWFLFGTAIGAAASLTVHVANGMTRRSFIRGALAAGTANGLLHGLAVTVAIAGEGAFYERMGWQHDLEPGSDFKAGVWENGIDALLVDSTVSALGATVSGLLVAIAYHRLGGWYGTLTLPLTLLPLLLTASMSNWAGSWMPLRLGEWGGSLTGVAVLVVAAGCFVVITRTVPINTKKA